MMPQQTGMMPQQTGMMPQQTGYNQGNGMMPQMTGYNPQMGMGYMPQGPGSQTRTVGVIVKPLGRMNAG